MKSLRALLLVMGMGLFLSACTATKPPDYPNLPARDSLMAGEEITVEPNENLYTIAHKYGVQMRDIIALNELKNPSSIKTGQRLLLPLKSTGEPKIPHPAPRMPIQIAPLTSSGSVVTSAPLDPPSSGAVSNGPLTPKTEARKPLETTVSNKSKAAPVAVASVGVASSTTSAPVQLADKTPVPKPIQQHEEPESGSSRFTALPPVQGPVIANFGEAGNDGINIAAPKGSSVVAAAGGIVVYSGNEMKGFGNLILVRHEGGWVTAYAHLDRMLVSKDAVVAAGDQIGTVGTSGGVSTPQLHFEARQDSKAVDPKTILKSE